MPDSNNDPFGTISRRALLGAMAGAVLSLPVVYDAVAVAAERSKVAARKGYLFDLGWRFHRGELSGAHGFSYTDSSWRRVDLPHDFSIEDLPGGSTDGGITANPSMHIWPLEDEATKEAPERIGPFDRTQSAGGRDTAYTVGGEGWYRKHFRLDGLRSGQRVELRLDGVQQVCDVWVNGHHLGFCPNGYVVQSYDLTPHLRRDAENVVAVRARNLGQNSRWYTGSGMYRHAWLTVTDPVHVPLWGVDVRTRDVASRHASLAIRTTVRNASIRAADVHLTVRILDSDGRVVATTTSLRRLIEGGEAAKLEVDLTVNDPRLWSPSDPYLYSAEVDVLSDGERVDRVRETFGIRSLVMDDKGFRLNGEPYEMRGANLHHDHGPLGAAAHDSSEERRVRKLKEAGYNAVRTAHNPPSPALLDVCDRLGVLVCSEFADTWDEPKRPNDYSVYFAEHWKRDATAWVLSGRNHPSVVIWSIGNEIGVATLVPDPDEDPDAQAERGKEMADFVRALDPTRPVCQGGAQGIWFFAGPNPRSDADAYTDLGDIHYLHDYGARPLANPGKAFLQSESFPATTYDDWKLVTDNDFAIGDFVWTGWDYLGEAALGISELVPAGTGTPLSATDDPSGILQVGGVIGPYPWYGAGCGDFDLIGHPKPQLRYRRVVWGDSPLELLVERPVGEGLEQRAMCWGWFDELESWTWDEFEGRLMNVRAYSLGDRVDLYLDGSLIGTTLITPASKRIASFRVPYRPGTLTAVASRSGQEIARKNLTTAGSPAALRLGCEEGTLTAGREDLAHIAVEVVDAKNQLVPDAVTEVGFEIGGADLVAVGNGNSHNVDSFQRPRRYTFHGVAMAFVRPPRAAGAITVTARAQGLEPAYLRIPVR